MLTTPNYAAPKHIDITLSEHNISEMLKQCAVIKTSGVAQRQRQKAQAENET